MYDITKCKCHAKFEFCYTFRATHRQMPLIFKMIIFKAFCGKGNSKCSTSKQLYVIEKVDSFGKTFCNFKPSKSALQNINNKLQKWAWAICVE